LRILALSAQVPYPPHHGKAMRDYALLAGLSQQHAVDLLCMARDDAEVEAAGPLARQVPFRAITRPDHGMAHRLVVLALSGRPDVVWRNWSPAFQQLLAARLEKDRPDLLLVEGLEMAAYGLWVRQQGADLPMVLDEHNAEHLIHQRAWEIARKKPRDWPKALYSWLQAGKLRRFEALACRAYDRVVAVSPDDRRALEHIAPQARITVVPNGLDTEEYAPLEAQAPPGPPRVVFTGQMGYRPNVDAVQWFCEAIWPLIQARVPEVQFQIVGRDPPPQVQALGEHPGIEVTGAVPDDRPYIGHADVYVLPMRFGGGIRFKLLQALSMGRAVVSTPLGAEGVEGLLDRKHLFLAEAAAAFADDVVHLLSQPEERARLGTAGRSLVQAHYDWRTLVPRFATAIDAACRQEG
jgi:sugar transferase (PEP-CTERM/EpsH1 system associated)